MKPGGDNPGDKEGGCTIYSRKKFLCDAEIHLNAIFY